MLLGKGATGGAPSSAGCRACWGHGAYPRFLLSCVAFLVHPTLKLRSAYTLLDVGRGGCTCEEGKRGGLLYIHENMFTCIHTYIHTHTDRIKIKVCMRAPAPEGNQLYSITFFFFTF